VPKFPLNDSRIRPALVRYLVTRRRQPKAIIEELRVRNGYAVADVVALFDEAHCFEIKGDSDKISRIGTQGAYYNTAFRLITLVTTVGNLPRALALAPRFWGVIIVSADASGELLFDRVRTAQTNPRFDKELAVQTLWKDEMLSLLRREDCKRKPRNVLARLISDETKKCELSNRICEILHSRHLTKYS